MVEALILVFVIIAIRAVYLWIVRGAADAKAFVEQSTDEVNKTMGCFTAVGLIILAAIIMMLAS